MTTRNKTTNPFAFLVLHAVTSYHKTIVEISSQQTMIPRILIYTVGTSLLATVIYKSMKKEVEPESEPALAHSPVTGPTTVSFLSKIFNYVFKKSTIKNDNNNIAEEQQSFEDKYFEEYDEWLKRQILETNEVHKKECLENMYYTTVRETINEFYGDVIMCYDHKTSSFAYYARTGNIPYKYLETISRKYMIDTNAPREIHVDIRNEYSKAKDRLSSTSKPAQLSLPDSDSGADSEPEEDTGVFVKLKSYNNASNLKIHTNTNDKIEKTHKFVDSTTSNTKVTGTTSNSSSRNTTKIIRENANRYSYRGKITDFAEHHGEFLAERRTGDITPTTPTTPTTTPTTYTASATTGYSEFKKQMMKSAL